ncbi:OpgC family protein [Roseibium aggregatum]|uniref:OpgC family protein n=1 Tax=Roseibium aggregatum TaxID=187304 RepID=UPI000A584730|nr:OpgC domain-containing protein [Roseibium aggregatum]MCR9281893.1 OpgC domain-containing protein [Paracoccaceae bacterium]
MNAHTQTKRPRDPRLDFFRGLGMFIIYVAHLPWNWWTLWIPARFGFSDATEIFVFCSGMASALAFGKIFDVHGWGMGAARILHRMWQVYWAHIGQFLVLAVGLVMLQNSGYLAECCGLEENYVASLNLLHLYDNAEMALPGLLTMTWVPNYFDILPMYVVILSLIPAIMLVARYSVPGAFALSIGLWLAAQFDLLSLPAEPWSDREWFFNPFAWQMLFFTGFAFMRGWIPAPPVSKTLIVICAVVLVATVPFAYFRAYQENHLNLVWAREIREIIKPLWIKTEFGLFRYLHFLALAYLAWVAAGEHGRRLLGHGEIWGRFVRVVQKVGQQSLPVFMASLVIAQAAGILRDMVWGRGEWLPQILSNLLGFVALIAVAYVAGWYKSQPWRKPPATSSTGPSERPKTPPADGGEPAAKAKAETREPALT